MADQLVTTANSYFGRNDGFPSSTLRISCRFISPLQWQSQVGRVSALTSGTPLVPACHKQIINLRDP